MRIRVCLCKVLWCILGTVSKSITSGMIQRKNGFISYLYTIYYIAIYIYIYVVTFSFSFTFYHPCVNHVRVNWGGYFLMFTFLTLLRSSKLIYSVRWIAIVRHQLGLQIFSIWVMMTLNFFFFFSFFSHSFKVFRNFHVHCSATFDGCFLKGLACLSKKSWKIIDSCNIITLFEILRQVFVLHHYNVRSTLQHSTCSAVIIFESICLKDFKG